MKRWYSLFFLLASLIFIPISFSQEEPIKVIPIGDTIKPEGKTEPKPEPKQAPAPAPTAAPKPTEHSTPIITAPKPEVAPKPAVKKRKPAPSLVKAGESFIVELQTVLSSGLNQTGDTFYFRAVENVGSSSRPVIKAGAVGTGTVTNVVKEKKKGNLAIRFDTITSSTGEAVPVSGGTELEGQGGQAVLTVGDRFTATLPQKVTLKGKPKKETEPVFDKMGWVEISGKGVDADIVKGFVKGNVGIILEPPKGMSIEDIDLSSVVLYRVNSFVIPQPVFAQLGKQKSGDQNKNGVSDAALTIRGWDFIKYQPRGKNVVYFMGKTKAGESFEASTPVTIDY